jgi:hypothetical protein
MGPASPIPWAERGGAMPRARSDCRLAQIPDLLSSNFSSILRELRPQYSIEDLSATT